MIVMKTIAEIMIITVKKEEEKKNSLMSLTSTKLPRMLLQRRRRKRAIVGRFLPFRTSLHENLSASPPLPASALPTLKFRSKPTGNGITIRNQNSIHTNEVIRVLD
ncbi:hypothetical protein ElyMa_005662200 [Elysia marginata]|uniref:Uncharacterized protein n=1 Tax=Elysia marginata TaxID=1093978 RepID=A0AAV4FDG2_9GAST|nr:hypothetical protein ElyMa_005662200 [Elysia marginata]